MGQCIVRVTKRPVAISYKGAGSMCRVFGCLHRLHCIRAWSLSPISGSGSLRRSWKLLFAWSHRAAWVNAIKVRKRLQTVSHYWCTISLNRLVQFSLRYLANRAVWFRRSTPRFAPIVYRYLDIRQCNPKISIKTLLTGSKCYYQSNQQSNQCFSDDESFHYDILYRTTLSKMRDKEIDTFTKSSLYCITKGLN